MLIFVLKQKINISNYICLTSINQSKGLMVHPLPKLCPPRLIAEK